MKTITIDGYHDNCNVEEGFQLLLVSEDGTQKRVSFKFEGGTYSTPKKAVACLLKRLSNRFPGFTPDYYVEETVKNYVEDYFDTEKHWLPSHDEAQLIDNDFREEVVQKFINTMAKHFI